MSRAFKIGGEITVNRLGFGAMQITGPACGARRATAPKRCGC